MAEIRCPKCNAICDAGIHEGRCLECDYSLDNSIEKPVGTSKIRRKPDEKRE